MSAERPLYTLLDAAPIRFIPAPPPLTAGAPPVPPLRTAPA